MATGSSYGWPQRRLFLATAIGCALLLPRSFGLTALSDIVQCFYCCLARLAFVPAARRCHGRLRLFWVLISGGVALWFCYQVFWTYYEVVLQAGCARFVRVGCRPVPAFRSADGSDCPAAPCCREMTMLRALAGLISLCCSYGGSICMS